MVQRFPHVMIAEARLGSLADSGKRSGQHCRRALDHGGRNGVLGRINLIFQISTSSSTCLVLCVH